MSSGRWTSLLSALVALLLAAAPAQAQEHFTDCVTNTQNATIFIPESIVTSLGDAAELETGDEIALYAEDGTCAGVTTWDGNSTAISAASGDEFNDYALGFDPEEPLKFKVWDASEDVVYDAGDEGAIYTTCSICTHEDGLYRTDAIMEVGTLEASSTLPVELTSFDARVDGNRAALEWKTATETNNAGFEVQYQRGDEPTEKSAWTTLDFVDGNGTTSKPQTYRYETKELSIGTYHFRLKQVDFDGAFEYSPTVEVALTMTEAFKLSAPYPNPFQHRANVALTLAEQQNVQIALYNTLGQRVALVHDGPLAPNTKHEFNVDGSRLPSGLYLMRARGESFSATRRLTHVR
jgi:hypothetical protein